MTLHKEIHFETEICEHLASNGWLYSQSDAAAYNRARALFPADVLAWVQATQPKSWDALEKNHGAQAADVLLNRLRDSINQRGTLDVLRHGIELLGLRQPLALAQFNTQGQDSGAVRSSPQSGLACQCRQSACAVSCLFDAPSN